MRKNKNYQEQKIFLCHLVTIQNYGGYWIQKPAEKTIQCFGKDETILDCEDDTCITNCIRSYEIQNATATNKRDSNVIGYYNLQDEIQWENNDTWVKKGTC